MPQICLRIFRTTQPHRSHHAHCTGNLHCGQTVSLTSRPVKTLPCIGHKFLLLPYQHPLSFSILSLLFRCDSLLHTTFLFHYRVHSVQFPCSSSPYISKSSPHCSFSFACVSFPIACEFNSSSYQNYSLAPLCFCPLFRCSTLHIEANQFHYEAYLCLSLTALCTSSSTHGSSALCSSIACLFRSSLFLCCTLHTAFAHPCTSYSYLSNSVAVCAVFKGFRK